MPRFYYQKLHGWYSARRLILKLLEIYWKLTMCGYLKRSCVLLMIAQIE